MNKDELDSYLGILNFHIENTAVPQTGRVRLTRRVKSTEYPAGTGTSGTRIVESTY